MKKRKLAIVGFMILVLFAIGIAAIGTIASSQVYFLREGAGGTLFCRAEEAYLFMDGTRRGYHFSYVKYPWIALGEFLHAPPFPDDRRVSDIVVRVTSSGAERHLVDFGKETGNAARSITPFDDGFYAQCPGVILCKWTGNGFEPATEEEQRRHDGTKRLSQGNATSGTINGWSVYRVGFSPGDHFEVQVGDKLVIAAKNQTADQGKHGWISVDLIRPDQPPERLYEVNGAPRRVSRSEYERSFH
jgi:hypothetical protein